MRVTREDRDGVAVLQLEGEFDSFETELVRDGFEACLQEGFKNVVLDLAGLSFANSTTIAYFITAQKRAQSSGGKVVIARPRDFIKKTLITLGLDQVFSISPDIDTAVAALKSA